MKEFFRRFKRWVLRPKEYEKERTDKGSICAKKIREEIERLSPFTLKPTGVAVESGYVEDLDVESKDLDYDVLYNGERIASIEVSCPNYTFEDSKIMPVNYYKGRIIKDLEVPAFVVFSMERENRLLVNRCLWIHGKDVVKSPDEWRFLGGKDQHNYMTDKADWHRGLRSLIDELEKIVEDSK